MKYRVYWVLSLLFIPAVLMCAQQSEIQIENRDLENLAIIDEIHPITLEKALNACATQAGKEYFKDSLRQLSSDIKALEAKQKNLKALCANLQELKKVNTLIGKCASAEHSLEPFMDKSHLTGLEEFQFERSLFLSLNKKSAALTASFFLHYVHLFAPLIEHALLHAGIDSVFSKLTDTHDHHSHSHSHHHHGCGCSHAHGFSKTDLAYYAIQAAHWGMHIPGYYEIWTHMQSRRTKIINAQQKIADLKLYLENVHALYDHLSALHPEFIAQHTPTLQRMFSMDPKHDELAAMVNTVLTTSWDSTVQNTLMPGTIIAMYSTIRANRQFSHKIAQEIGIIDAYAHVASLLAESTEKKPYCFVQFVSQQTPMVHLENLWHHAIKSDTMRPLTIAIGKEYGCMIVQGANGSGKSTMLTALGHALFLAQSWAIAPARSAIITPFATIYTHSLKRDAIERGLSHFYTEHAYYESMFTRNSRGLSIALLDEPYTCTDATTGTNYLSDLVHRIEESNERTAVITTHYAW